MSHVYLVSLYLVILLMAVGANRDLLSPSKLYLYVLGCSWATVFYEEQEWSTYLCFVLLMIPAVAGMVIEHEGITRRPILTGRQIAQADKSAYKVDWLMWVATLIPVSAMAGMIVHFGGMTGYRLALASRASKFAGLGWLRTISIAIGPLNCCYLAILLRLGKRPARYLPYIVNFVLASSILAATGGRVNLMDFLVVVLGVWHYSVKRLHPGALIGVAVVCLALLATISIFRMNQRQIDFSTPLSKYESRAASAFFNYGPESTAAILAAPSFSLKYGSTYLAAITNMIPRAWWRDKPREVDAAFTVELLGDPNRGASNTNPTFLAEGMFNFGILWGGLFALVTLSLAMIAIARRYIRVTIYEAATKTGTLAITMYMYVAICTSEAVFGDFATVFGKLVIVSGVVWPVWSLFGNSFLRSRVVRGAASGSRMRAAALHRAPYYPTRTVHGPGVLSRKGQWK